MAETDQRLEKMIKVLRDAGRRITPQRLAVLKILAESSNHPSVEMIYSQVKKRFPTTSLATVYKTVTLLKELQEVLELGFAGGGSRYDGKRPFPHPHVVCTKCGAIVDPQFPTWKKWLRRWPRSPVSRLPITAWTSSGSAPIARMNRDKKFHL